MRPPAVQLCPLSPGLTRELARRLDIAPLHRLTARQAADWLARHGPHVAVAITSGKHGCPSDLIARLPALQLIAVHGVGLDRIDLPLTRQRGIRIATTPDALTDDVADLAVGLVIALLRNLPTADRHVRAGSWEHTEMPLARRVSGKRFGILGLGRIGSAIARRLAPFGPVGYTSREPKPVDWAYHPDPVALARASDVLIVACAATAATAGMVDAQVLAALGPDGWLVNVARGAIVDEAALIRALDADELRGAALDVFSDEPLVAPALRASARTVLSPHHGSATSEARAAMAAQVLAAIDAFLAERTPGTGVQ